MDLARAQRKAAELVLEDEAWRDGLEDDQATALLDAALAWTDATLAQAAAAGTLDGELPYEVASQARAALMDRAGSFPAPDPPDAPGLPDAPEPPGSPEPPAPCPPG